MTNPLMAVIKRTLPHFINLYIKRVGGVENIPAKGPFIVVANHTSYLDHYLVASVLLLHKHLYLRFLAKKEHFESTFQKKWHEMTEAIPIDRQKNWRVGLAKAKEELQKGAIIGIYPEGTRSTDGKLQKGKLGVARLALSAQVHVLPVGIVGAHKILPKGSVVPKASRVTISIGPPLVFKQYYGKEEEGKILKEVTTQIMKSIATLSNQRYDFK